MGIDSDDTDDTDDDRQETLSDGISRSIALVVTISAVLGLLSAILIAVFCCSRTKKKKDEANLRRVVRGHRGMKSSAQRGGAISEETDTVAETVQFSEELGGGGEEGDEGGDDEGGGSDGWYAYLESWINGRVSYQQ